VHQPFLAESRAVLHDLENRVLEATLALAERRARWRRIQIACVVVAVILLALGLAVAVWRGWS
jgi:anti-sigma-K factor RskA